MEALDQFGSFFFVLQIKGTKSYSKSIMEDSSSGSFGDCLHHAIDQFKKEFSTLDWEYMQDRRAGELMCDIGITFHPNSPEPLVGLWRLDSLEASYGAAGYCSGNMHTINTLELFGGLQAEMAGADERQQRTHIAFRSSYNLAYEVTRPTDNSRDLFTAKDAYNMNPTIEQQVRSVVALYKGRPSGKSYGVRDEFRVGGAALNLIEDCLESVVSDRVCFPPF